MSNEGNIVCMAETDENISTLEDTRYKKNNYLISLENEISISREFLWHTSLLRFSNQVEVLSNIFGEYIKDLYIHTDRNDFIIMELGCKGAEAMSSLFNSKKFDKALFYYFGLDTNDEILKYAKINTKKFVNSFFPSISNLNTPLEEINWSECDLDLLIFNNIPYYTFQIKDFISNLFLKRTRKQKVIFVNESPLSDLGYLRNRFGSEINSKNYNEIITSLKNEYISFRRTYFDIIINFPNYENEIWTNLYEMDCNKEDNMNQDYMEAKALLEYIVQRPLEFLFEEGLLKQYLDNIRIFLKKQNNQIISRNTLFIVN